VRLPMGCPPFFLRDVLGEGVDGRPTTFVGIVIVWFAAGIVFGIGGGQLCGVIGQRAPMVVSGDGCGRSTTPFCFGFHAGQAGCFCLVRERIGYVVWPLRLFPRHAGQRPGRWLLRVVVACDCYSVPPRACMAWSPTRPFDPGTLARATKLCSQLCVLAGLAIGASFCGPVAAFYFSKVGVL